MDRHALSIETLDAAELAVVLHKSIASVRADVSRAPHRLPPTIRTGGGKALWLRQSVLDWLISQQAPAITQPAPAPSIKKRRGAPTKAERLRQAAAKGVCRE